MSEPKQLEKYGAYKDQADAWNAVWEALAKHNPEFIYEGQTGEEAALIEIRRLQQIAFLGTVLALVDPATIGTVEDGILPCPWCHSKSIKFFEADGLFYAQCQDCNACGPDHKNGWHWNLRRPARTS